MTMWPVIGFLVAANSAFHKNDSDAKSKNQSSEAFHKIHVIGEGKWLCVAPEDKDNLFPFIVRADSARVARELSQEACEKDHPGNTCNSLCAESENTKTQIEEFTEASGIETLHVGDRRLPFEASFLDKSIPKFYTGYATTELEARALAQQACFIGKTDKELESCEFQESQSRGSSTSNSSSLISIPIVKVPEPKVKVQAPKWNFDFKKRKKKKKN